MQIDMSQDVRFFMVGRSSFRHRNDGRLDHVDSQGQAFDFHVLEFRFSRRWCYYTGFVATKGDIL
jgi:hypothetical protein